MRKTLTAAAMLGSLTAVLLTAGPAPASPPPSWTNERVLNCGGSTIVAYRTPAGFGSAFQVVGSTDLIEPVHVEALFPDDPDTLLTTLHVPGFEDRDGLVHCAYTDPLGLIVRFDGLRT